MKGEFRSNSKTGVSAWWCRGVRLVVVVVASEGLTEELKASAAAQFADPHPERMLLAYVMSELTDWVERNGLAGTDNYGILAAVNMVNCVAHAEVTKRSTRAASPGRSAASKRARAKF